MKSEKEIHILQSNIDSKLSEADKETFNALLERIMAPEPKVWKPESGESFWYISCLGNARKTTESFRGIKTIYSIGNCFKDKKDAEFAIEQLKVMQELREYASKKQPHYETKWFFVLKDDLLRMEWCTEMVTQIFFDTEEDGLKAIEAIGKDRLKKYYFGITE